MQTLFHFSKILSYKQQQSSIHFIEKSECDVAFKDLNQTKSTFNNLYQSYLGSEANDFLLNQQFHYIFPCYKHIDDCTHSVYDIFCILLSYQKFYSEHPRLLQYYSIYVAILASDLTELLELCGKINK